MPGVKPKQSGVNQKKNNKVAKLLLTQINSFAPFQDVSRLLVKLSGFSQSKKLHRPPRVLAGPKFFPSFTEIILVDISLDNNAFIAFFTGEPGDNYFGKDVCPLPWLNV